MTGIGVIGCGMVGHAYPGTMLEVLLGLQASAAGEGRIRTASRIPRPTPMKVPS